MATKTNLESKESEDYGEELQIDGLLDFSKNKKAMIFLAKKWPLG